MGFLSFDDRDCYLLRLFCSLRLAQADTRAAAVLVDELDAGQLICPYEPSDRLRPSYRFFLGALAVWPRTAFTAADGLDAAAASAERAAAALVRRTPG